MKTCPICQAITFDDAAICFGCMHHFEEKANEEADVHAQAKPTCNKNVQQAAETTGFPFPTSNLLPNDSTHIASKPPAAFTVRVIPVAKPEGDVFWDCRVEAV